MVASVRVAWLDETDLFFIDPGSTGYSRAAPGADARQFHGFNEDIASVGDFIRLYTSRQQCRSSPKFLVGESYGTTRASALGDYLQDRDGLDLNGMALVSSLMNFATARFPQGNDLPFLLFLPTYTAGAWYHRKLGGAFTGVDLRTALRAAEKFVQEKYAPALRRGDALPAAEKAVLAKEVAALTGMPEAFVLQRNLRIDIFTYTSKLLEDKDRSVGRYDCRLTGIRYQPGTSGAGRSSTRASRSCWVLTRPVLTTTAAVNSSMRVTCLTTRSRVNSSRGTIPMFRTST